MKRLPAAAYLLLQEMRHYLLIQQIESLKIEEIDTDAYMLSLADTVGSLLGLNGPKPDEWINTYTLYVDEARRYAISDPEGLEQWALQGYQALKLMAKASIE